MYKNENKNEHHDREPEKTIENAIVENSPKEHLKEYENKKKEKFDYKKFCHKKRESDKGEKANSIDIGTMESMLSGYGNKIDVFHLPNGFDFRVIYGKDGLIEDIDLSYNYRELGKRLSVFQIFPELAEQKNLFHRSSDAMICDCALKLAQNLPAENQEQFLDSVYNRK